VRLFAVRHAKTVVEGVCYGQHDVEVVGTHDAAAAEVHEALLALGAKPAALFSSPWSRASRLADAFAARIGLTAVLDARLSELSFGEWEGRRWDELEREDGARLSAWMADYTVERPPGGESVADLEARILSFVEEHRPRAGDVVVVAHAGPIRALRRLGRATSWGEEFARSVPFLGVSEVLLARRTDP
jgi:alpha-ribazole phosphatase